MTKLNLTLAAGAFALAAASAAFAQPGTMDQAPSPQSPTPQGQAATPQGQDAMGAQGQPQAPSAAAAGYNSSAVVIMPNGVEAIHQGDNTEFTNGPVPDTAANRAKFGGPMSRTGMHTKPAGN